MEILLLTDVRERNHDINLTTVISECSITVDRTLVQLTVLIHPVLFLILWLKTSVTNFGMVLNEFHDVT